MIFVEIEAVLVPKQVLSFIITLALIAGFTVTFTVKGVPTQVPEVGVTVYVTTTGFTEVLINVWLILVWGVDCAPSPVIVPGGFIVGAVQV